MLWTILMREVRPNPVELLVPSASLHFLSELEA